jgi:hypothetical protein
LETPGLSEHWYDIDAYVTLISDEGPIVGFNNIYMNTDPAFENWSIQLLNIPDDAISYKINWNPGAREWWNQTLPIEDEIDRQSAEIDVITHVVQ